MNDLFISHRISVDTETTEYKNTLGSRVWLLDVGVFVGLPTITLLFRDHLPAWLFMWLMAVAIYLGCKWLTWRQAQRAASSGSLCWGRALCYFLLWPGMDAKTFCAPALPRQIPGNRTLAATLTGAVLNTALGALLLFAAAYLSNRQPNPWIGWLGMLGIILFLHFGMFDLLAVGWRKAGLNVKSVMRAPIRATSLGEFWGRRWNTAFNALAHESAFRPLVRVFERAYPCRHRRAVALATLTVFVISGLVHELAISLPACGGYGLPTAYFVFQGLAVLLERSPFGRQIGLGYGLRGWLFTAACTAGPAFWLFHPTFIRNVILPMLHTLGGN